MRKLPCIQIRFHHSTCAPVSCVVLPTLLPWHLVWPVAVSSRENCFVKITDILRTNCPFVVHHSINLTERLPSFSIDTRCTPFMWAAAQVHAGEEDRVNHKNRSTKDTKGLLDMIRPRNCRSDIVGGLGYVISGREQASPKRCNDQGYGYLPHSILIAPSPIS